MVSRATYGRTAKAARTSRLVGASAIAACSLLSIARAADRSDTSLACVEAWGESRYRNAGYDHIVHVRNRCEKAVICRVSTNVNPDPVEGTVAAGEERELLTFRGSPARDFVPKVDCKLLM
jgi:hypothetical protein